MAHLFPLPLLKSTGIKWISQKGQSHVVPEWSKVLRVMCTVRNRRLSVAHSEKMNIFSFWLSIPLQNAFIAGLCCPRRKPGYFIVLIRHDYIVWSGFLTLGEIELPYIWHYKYTELHVIGFKWTQEILSLICKKCILQRVEKYASVEGQAWMPSYLRNLLAILIVVSTAVGGMFLLQSL